MVVTGAEVNNLPIVLKWRQYDVPPCDVRWQADIRGTLEREMGLSYYAKD